MNIECCYRAGVESGIGFGLKVGIFYVSDIFQPNYGTHGRYHYCQVLYLFHVPEFSHSPDQIPVFSFIYTSCQEVEVAEIQNCYDFFYRQVVSLQAGLVDFYQDFALPAAAHLHISNTADSTYLLFNSFFCYFTQHLRGVAASGESENRNREIGFIVALDYRLLNLFRQFVPYLSNLFAHFQCGKLHISARLEGEHHG